MLKEDWIMELIKTWAQDFEKELRTDENADYRRGFYAGRLMAVLSIKNIVYVHEGKDDE